ncbi:MAG: hypothetical protein ABNH02_11290 [Pseudomonadales bacterium]|jgi:hypothetical protein
MKSDFLNWAMALFAVGVLITGGLHLLDGEEARQPVAALQQGLISSTK